ncbi:MAG TPA: pilus assembly protein TadG-related protein [Desulfobacteria bacterium]|nr:pilus assembly protein TadG-related protein [Desulfobacteria bacterium]
MKRFALNERGSITILSAIVIVVLVGFAALAVDGGYLYYRHTRLQDITDAAALSAAAKIADTHNASQKKDNGFSEAKLILTKNRLSAVDEPLLLYTARITTEGNESGIMTVSYPDASGVGKVKVTMNVDANTYFAKVFGNTGASINVTATAQVGQSSIHSGQLAPFSFFWDTYTIGQPYNLSLSPNDGTGGGVSGNYGFLDYGDNFANNVMYGWGGTLRVGEEKYTYPGETVGPMEDGILYRIQFCTANHDPDCTEISYVEDCPRIVVIPIVSNFSVAKGRSQVTIVGFAKFFITGYDKDTKILSGYFLQALDVTEISGSPSQYMVNGIKLIE